MLTMTPYELEHVRLEFREAFKRYCDETAVTEKLLRPFHSRHPERIYSCSSFSRRKSETLSAAISRLATGTSPEL